MIHCRAARHLGFITVFLLMWQAAAFAQSPNATNYVSFVSNQAITFTLNSAALLESTQTISNAFYLKMEAAYTNGAHFYVSATASCNTSTPMPVSNLLLTFYSTTCPASYYSNLNTSDITLSGSNQLLFQQISKSTSYNYSYSVKMPAVGYTYLPGTYTFNLTFTMTEP